MSYTAKTCDASLREASTSSVTHTGRAHTTRGSARPASAAACRNVGMVRSASVRGPTHHVLVPSARVPATRSICGPSAATTTDGRTEPATVMAPCTRNSSPSYFTGWPSSRGISTERYSRRWRTGFSNDSPHIISTTIWCDRPMPRHSRLCEVPPMAACTVSACWASIIGCRG